MVRSQPLETSRSFNPGSGDLLDTGARIFIPRQTHLALQAINRLWIAKPDNVRLQ